MDRRPPPVAPPPRSGARLILLVAVAAAVIIFAASEAPVGLDSAGWASIVSGGVILTLIAARLAVSRKPLPAWRATR